MFNFNFDKVSSTSHSIYLRRFRPKTVFLSKLNRGGSYCLPQCTIKVFINLTMYLSSNFYERIEFLKISSDYILFICVVLDQKRFLYFYTNRGRNHCRPQHYQGIYQPYIVFIFEFLWESWISQKSFRLHSIYLHSTCVFIKKS